MNNLTFKVLNGESGSVDIQDIACSKEAIANILASFEKDLIFNCDETGLFYDCFTGKQIKTAKRTERGKKQRMDSITLLLCTNATGTEKFPLYTVNSTTNPTSSTPTISSKVKWYVNNAARMNNTIFDEFLKSFNDYIRTKYKEKRAVLIMDNAPVHNIVLGRPLSNVICIFLPANTSSKLQPLHQGIIAAFKKQYYNLRLDYKRKVRKITFQSCVIDVGKAAELCAKSWELVSRKTIINCFLSANILPNYHKEEMIALKDAFPVISTRQEILVDEEEFFIYYSEQHQFDKSQALQSLISSFVPPTTTVLSTQ
jgi:hypothetical protein